MVTEIKKAAPKSCLHHYAVYHSEKLVFIPSSVTTVIVPPVLSLIVFAVETAVFESFFAPFTTLPGSRIPTIAAIAVIVAPCTRLPHTYFVGARRRRFVNDRRWWRWRRIIAGRTKVYIDSPSYLCGCSTCNHQCKQCGDQHSLHNISLSPVKTFCLF